MRDEFKSEIKIKWWQYVLLWLVAVFAIIFLLTSYATSETYTYLVYADNFPQDRYRTSISTINPTYSYFKYVGITDIKSAKGQPFRLTCYNKIYNPKYAIFTITPNDILIQQLNSMEKQGYIKLIETIEIISTYYLELGGYIVEVKQKKYEDFPLDLYSLSTSTPVKE
jgi:hypothetical protein